MFVSPGVWVRTGDPVSPFSIDASCAAGNPTNPPSTILRIVIVGAGAGGSYAIVVTY